MGDPGSILGLGRFPWRRKWQPTPVQVFLPGEFHGRRSLVGYSPRGRKESDTTERLHFHFQHVLLTRKCLPPHCLVHNRPMLDIKRQYPQQSACQVGHMVGLSSLSSLTRLQMFEDASLGQAGLQRNGQRHSGWQTGLRKDRQTEKQLR